MIRRTIMDVVRDRPFPERMADLLLDSLVDAINGANKSISAAKEIDRGKEWDGSYDWGPRGPSKEIDINVLDFSYLDGNKRNLVELMVMSIRGCSIEMRRAQDLHEKLRKVSDGIRNSGYSKDMADTFDAALKCVARLSLWTGRLDFSCRGEKIDLHDKAISEKNSSNAKKRYASTLGYKREIFENLNYCLGLGRKYDKWEDYVDFNQEIFDSVNESFLRGGSKVQVVRGENLVREIRSWAKTSKEFGERLESVVSKVKAINRRNNGA